MNVVPDNPKSRDFLMKLLRFECDKAGNVLSKHGFWEDLRRRRRDITSLKCNFLLFRARARYQCQNGVLLIGSSHATAFRRDFPWNFLLNF